MYIYIYIIYIVNHIIINQSVSIEIHILRGYILFHYHSYTKYHYCYHYINYTKYINHIDKNNIIIYTHIYIYIYLYVCTCIYIYIYLVNHIINQLLPEAPPSSTDGFGRRQKPKAPAVGRPAVNAPGRSWSDGPSRGKPWEKPWETIGKP